MTPIDADKFEELLCESNYDPGETAFIVNGFRKGFSIEYTGPTNRQDYSRNLKCRVGTPTDLWNKVMGEVKLKRTAGPFAEVPFNNFIQSPIGLVPKHEPGQSRLIFHLSYPEGNSVNHHCPKEKCSVSYPDFSLAVQDCIRQGKGCYMAKSDFKSAFKVLPISKDCWQWLVMMAVHPKTGQKMFFVEKTLPFGHSISCAHFQRVSDAIAHLQWWRTGSRPRNYLDDFLFIALLKTCANSLLQSFLDLCDLIKFPVSLDKTFWAEQVMVFLGILIDALNQRLGIPTEKIQKAIDQIEYILNSNKITVQQLQQLTGLLNFMGRAVVPGRVFTRRMYAKAPGLKQHHHLRVDKELKGDCKMWKQFLLHPSAVARPFVDFDLVVEAEEIGFFSDASRAEHRGIGIFWFPSWAQQFWDPGFIQACDPSIAFCELYALVVGVHLFKEQLQGRNIKVRTDNLSVVQMVNQTSSSCRLCMILLRKLVLVSLQHNFKISAGHIPTKKNVLADSLSRGEWARFWDNAPQGTMKTPLELPAELWPVPLVWWTDTNFTF